ncbi:hypothetical protein HMPREF0063_12932 [Aeromicrobium marinum DSM 15272]|uniref:Uncharacterized protein n=1 Tax=Aeromicrobium marinum DSM 15272 TaxID=585531 RepID=E2SFX3_9ACTN|nr:DUF6350 family protein [Aeromicrobium marinum]EFQ81920.1 hypothetical protein HMPREF0063_12932 [Aeromicrobium marinum DSM 15272]
MRPRSEPPSRPSDRTAGTAAAAALGPAFVAVATAVGVGLVVAFLGVWAAGGAGGSLLSTARATVQVWLVAHGSGITTGGTDVGLVPLGAVAVAVAVVAWSVRRTVDTPVAEPSALVAATAGAHGVVAALLSAVTDSTGASTSMVRAALVAFCVAGTGAAVGYAAAHGVPDLWWPQDRPELRAVVVGASVAAGAVVVCAAVVVAVLLGVRVERAGDLWALLDPGPGGGLALAVVCLLLVPTLVAWTVAALLGPGFVVGSDTSVDLTGSYLGEVPGLPVLAALPSPGEFPGWVFLLALVPVVAAAGAGWWLVRTGRVDTTTSMPRAVSVAAGSGAVGGLALALLARASGGSAGPGRMAEVGPTVWWPLLVGVPVMAAGAAIGATVAHYRGGRAEPR